MNGGSADLGRGHLGLRGLDAVRDRMLLFSMSDNGFHSVKTFWHYAPAPGLNARGDRGLRVAKHDHRLFRQPPIAATEPDRSAKGRRLGRGLSLSRCR